jgi:DNA-binding transcriptional regulator YiaG/uncharacterized phage-associated protein
MKSPYTGKEMRLVYEQRTWNFRGEEYPYIHTAYKCEDTGEQFTTDQTDTVGFIQATNQYRAKYGIPYTDEIIAIRARYGISAAKIAAILGIGTNQWRLYESGEVPSVSNGRIIRSIMHPMVFLDMVESSRPLLSDKEYANITQKVQVIISQSAQNTIADFERKRIFALNRGIDNGHSPISLDRLKSIMLAVLSECGDTFCTKMSKLLFYIDFLSYRQRGMAMTGLSYRAIDSGPVPDRWDRVYSEFDEITQEPCIFGEHEGNVLTANATPTTNILSDEDCAIIHTVCSAFKNLSSKDISAISHEEPAWQKYHDTHAHIPFTEAFTLKAL